MTYSFVIPNYNNPDMLYKCLYHIRLIYPSHEIIVIDDNSDAIDEIIKVCKHFKATLKKSAKNQGFGYNVNRGISSAQTDAVVIVNNDVFLTEDILKETDRILQDQRVGIVGYLLYYPDKTIQHAGIKFDNCFERTTHWKEYRMAYERKTLAVTGALMTIRKRMVDDIGGFDRRYIFAFEDTELCLRAWSNDWKVVFTPSVSAIHIEGYTRGATEQEKVTANTMHREQISHAAYLEDIKKYSYMGLMTKVRLA